ncbi:deoxyribose-phosphate aldolase [Geosporobacter ferrireducens]|uniref:Deoxyribose-phosphate aldolase n=1 Tax=Geosporobacter ferrireducens TaxID=1424294 RepID=A0A1D8GC44_9FIRM|nr:deoxyribose-phosphate aldolase [Geosporobacter ferrireducens]AOT68477.1 deoxyribose-phosphate aldolase [Geosporobacter ferrireducens]MTI53939.1 deoxyribose-phosphate aldolase [Geosporobacter ferrireducens]
MNIAKYIDHTVLKPDAQKQDIIKVCQEAVENGFYSVCVNSWYVPFVKEQLKGSDVKITSVVGFPLGAMESSGKASEAKTAIANGADEIDMVINIGALKDKEYDFVRKDIEGIVEVLKPHNILKVIIETCLLTEEEKIKACELSKAAGAHFVKTSTGFSTGGATVEDVILMKQIVGDRLQVKASGGIRNIETALKMIEAGATRLGTSASVSIAKGVESGNINY